MCSTLDKAELRSAFRKIRESIPDRQEKSRQICRKLLSHPAVLSAKTVFLYLSFGTEVETLSLAEVLLKQGKHLCVPRCNTQTRTMVAKELTSIASLQTGSYGILEPEPDAKVIPKEEIDLILLPALAFDKDGYRLGYGGGYYDKFLENFSGITLGLAFGDCVTDRLPRDSFDKPVDEIITEE